MRYIVDRAEEQMLVLENDEGQFVTVPKALIPEAKEGDVVEVNISRSKTEDRRRNVGQLMDKLFLD